MGLLRFKEPEKKPEVDIICDLDSIIERRAAFTLKGRTHYVDPITLSKFVQFVAKLNDVSKESTSSEAVIDKYIDMINTVCPTVTKKDIEGLAQSQLVMLFAAIVDKVMGRKPMSEEEKKNS